MEKYRQKRTKRNFTRSVDMGRRERAQSRTRDINGQFLIERKDTAREQMQSQLEASRRESLELQAKLSFIFSELQALRRKAEEASMQREIMKEELETQKRMNEVLMEENSLLWTTVPLNEVFSTIRGHSYVEAFKELVDLTQIKLNETDSRFLEAARKEQSEVEQRWEDMTFIAGART